MEPTVKYLKSIGTSKASIDAFKKWHKPKKKFQKKKKKVVVRKEKEQKEICIESRGESVIATLLGRQEIDFETEKTFPGLVSKKGGYLRFDFFLPDQNCLIEYDGIHHFKITKYSRSLSEVKRNDGIKNRWCKENKVPLLRVKAEDLENIKEIVLYFLDHI